MTRLNIEKFDQANRAYRAKDYATASILFNQVAQNGEPCGEAHHLRGNSLMRLGRVREAAEAYVEALEDSSYSKKGSVATNLGKAFMRLEDFQGAKEAFEQALEDPAYKSKYKALNGLGDAELKLNNVKSAGVAYRSAALDGHNPNPSQSLLDLGQCFVLLDRPGDAIESFRTALDFDMGDFIRSQVFEKLGQAYLGTKRYDESVNAFEQAQDTSSWTLSTQAQLDYEQAKSNLKDKRRRSQHTGSIGNTSEFLAAANRGYVSPEDSSAYMPSPEESGFFDITESDLVKLSKYQAKQEKKQKKTGLKILGAFVIAIIFIALALGFLYYKGYGYPSQSSLIENLFTTQAKSENINEYWLEGTDPALIKLRDKEITSKASNVELVGLDRGTNQSVARVKVTLEEGGVVHYVAQLERDGIGWKIKDIYLDFASEQK